MERPVYLSAREAAAELGIGLQTLYAYVSRGFIRSESIAGTRTRLYRAEDVRALRDRRERGRDAERSAEVALQGGAPVLDSALTLIQDGRLFYRGRDVAVLARTATLEAVATLLWDCPDSDPFAVGPSGDPAIPGAVPETMTAAMAGLPPLERCIAVLPAAAATDIRAWTLAPPAVHETAAGLARLVAATLVGRSPSDAPIHRQVAAAWGVADEAGIGLLRAALVLCADHELNASAFTVRCVASTGANLHAAVIAGIAALQGPRHGGATARVDALLAELLADPDPGRAMVARMRRGDDAPGFGHPLYPKGDPRAATLLAMIAATRKGDPVASRLADIVDVCCAVTGRRPNIDLGLVALARVLALPPWAPLILFAAGRCIGWIAHALEQYQGNALIRPRARYVGARPS